MGKVWAWEQGRHVIRPCSSNAANGFEAEAFLWLPRRSHRRIGDGPERLVQATRPSTQPGWTHGNGLSPRAKADSVETIH